MMSIREESGPDCVYWLGSAKHNNEQAYLFRKFAAYWGTNNVDHQARICHSTTVAGVANTWGYGAMTNSYNDIHNSQGDLHHRRQPGRGASGLAAAPAQGQGAEQRAADRLRPALHPHRGACRRIRPLPPRHGRGAGLGHPLAHLRERLGGQGVHPHPRLGHGPDPRRGRQLDARRGRARHRRAGQRSSSGSRGRWPTTVPAP